MYSVLSMIFLQLSGKINFSLREKRMFYSVSPKHKSPCKSGRENSTIQHHDSPITLDKSHSQR